MKIDKIGEILEFPREITSDIPKITITGFDEIMIENFKSILEYENYYIRIKTKIGNIIINGFDLNLNQINKEDICISGKIDNIDFESNRNV